MDKSIKAVIIFPEKDTYTVPDWATRFCQPIYPSRHLPSRLISDRDPKFISEFWKGLCKKAGAKFFLSIAYHPQTDGQSERINKTIEIALRYYISLHQDDRADQIELIQAAIGVVSSESTNHSHFESLFGFNPSHVVAGRSVADD